MRVTVARMASGNQAAVRTPIRVERMAGYSPPPSSVRAAYAAGWQPCCLAPLPRLFTVEPYHRRLAYTRQAGPVQVDFPVYFKIEDGTPAHLSEARYSSVTICPRLAGNPDRGPSRMNTRSIVAGCLLGAALLVGVSRSRVHAGNELARISIDYPLNGSVFPPDMAAPTLIWRDPAPGAGAWQIDVSFADGSTVLHAVAKGEPMQVGEIDKRCISNTNKLPELNPEQAAAHTWKPDPETWNRIKKQAGAGAVTIVVKGRAAALLARLFRADRCRSASPPIPLAPRSSTATCR